MIVYNREKNHTPPRAQTHLIVLCAALPFQTLGIINPCQVQIFLLGFLEHPLLLVALIRLHHYQVINRMYYNQGPYLLPGEILQI